MTKPQTQLKRPEAFDQSRRILITAKFGLSILVLLMIVVFGRVIMLMVQPDEYIKNRVENRGIMEPITARRGEIHDVKGRVMAATRIGYLLYINPKELPDVADRDRYILELASALEVDPASIEIRIAKVQAIRPKTQYIVLNRLLSDSQFNAVTNFIKKQKKIALAVARETRSKLKPVGLYMKQVVVREYPQGNLAGPIIGSVQRNTDPKVKQSSKGLEGLESALDEVLSDRSGKLHIIQDAKRKPMWVNHSGYQKPTDGESVRVSFDMVIQNIAQQELQQACDTYQAERGEIIVMHARTGQLLAMANWPFYDPNNLADSTDDLRRNRAVTDVYEPGSVFKPFFFAAALDQGIVKPSEMIDSTTSGVWVTSFGRRLRDAHAHGMVSFDKGLIVSSNIVMGKVGLRMGIPQMHKSMQAFGFGQKTGSLLPGEVNGILNPIYNSKGRKLWSKYSLTSVPMGQEVAVTPLQMVKAFSAFANDGMVVFPSVIAEEAMRPVYQKAVGSWAANHTRQVLYRVVEEGTGRKAISKLYRIWGKTGTAQVPYKDKRGYEPNAYTGNFICGAPLRDPEIIVAVIIHKPLKKLGYYGGVVAAPAAKNVVERSLVYIGVAPDKFGENRNHGTVVIAD